MGFTVGSLHSALSVVWDTSTTDEAFCSVLLMEYDAFVGVFMFPIQ